MLRKWHFGQTVVEHEFNPSTRKPEAGQSLLVRGQVGQKELVQVIRATEDTENLPVSKNQKIKMVFCLHISAIPCLGSKLQLFSNEGPIYVEIIFQHNVDIFILFLRL